MSQPTFVVEHASKDAREKREPRGAGFFGQHRSIEALIAESRAHAVDGCPSLEQFESHYGHLSQPKRTNGG